MTTNEAVNKISIFLGYASFGSCLFMWGRISGLEKGYLYGVFQEHLINNGFGWTIDGYQQFNIWYFYITVGFGVYLISKLFKPSFISSVMCVISLAIAFQQHLDMLGFNSYKLYYAAKVSDNVWTQNVPYFHWMLLAIVTTLIVIEFFLINRRKPEAIMNINVS